MPIRPIKRGQSSFSLLLSLVLHMVFALLLAILWQQRSVPTDQDWIEAQLLTSDESERPMLRRTRLSQRQETALPDPTISVSVDLPEFPDRVPGRVADTGRLPSFRKDEPLQFAQLQPEDRLSGPAGQGPRRPSGQDRGFTKPQGLVGSYEIGNATLHLGGERPARDGVGDAMMLIADALVRDAVDGKVDVLFLLDASGSMDPHIAAVARHLGDMARQIAEQQVDVRFGVIGFRRLGREDIVETWPLSEDLDQLREAMRSLRCEGDERTLDILAQTLDGYEMRPVSLKGYVLVTDERLAGKTSLDEVIRACQDALVRVHVLSPADAHSQRLAHETEGLWFPLPTSYE